MGLAGTVGPVGTWLVSVTRAKLSHITCRVLLHPLAYHQSKNILMLIVQHCPEHSYIAITSVSIVDVLGPKWLS